MPAAKRLRFRILACSVFLILYQLSVILAGASASLTPTADFRALYTAGSIVRAGHAAQLYDYDFERQAQNQTVSPRTAALPFIYPVYAALPFVPLSLLPYRTAYFTFLAINALALFAAALVLRPYLGCLSRLWKPLPEILLFTFAPVAIAFAQGQVSLFLLLLYCACFVALDRKRPFLAGLFLAVTLVKFHFALPVVLLFAIWRFWRFVAGFAAGALALVLLSLSISGVAGLASYGRSMLTAASQGTVGTSQSHYEVFSARMPNLHGLFYWLTGGAHWGTPLVIFASLAVLVWVALQPPSLPRALTAALLVSYHLHLHDLSLLLLPLSLILNEACEHHLSPRRFQSPKSTLGFRENSLFFAAILWLASPLILWIMGQGWNPVLALAMLPFLLHAGDVAESPDLSAVTVTPLSA